MTNTMLGLFNLGGGEILLILGFVLLMTAGVGVIGLVLRALWQLVKQRNSPRAVSPVQSPSSPPPPPSRTCPRCGAPLPAGAPQELCPRCVLGVGLATNTDAPGESGPHGTKVLQPPPAPADIARHFPQLEILECLGRGGMGVVYKARQPKLNRLVALKILAPEKGADPKFAERFLREAQALARLNHPNIVTVHDFGEADGLFYLLMEYVDGMTLRQLLQGQRLAPEQAMGIVPNICEALQFTAPGYATLTATLGPRSLGQRNVSRDFQLQLANSASDPFTAVPPVVIATAPESGVADVDPSLTELRVTFSKSMQDSSWGRSKWGEGSFPEMTDRPKFAADGHTCILPVRLQPGKVYAIWLNSEHDYDFKDREGRSAVPYLLIFETRK